MIVPSEVLTNLETPIIRENLCNLETPCPMGKKCGVYPTEKQDRGGCIIRGVN